MNTISKQEILLDAYQIDHSFQLFLNIIQPYVHTQVNSALSLY